MNQKICFKCGVEKTLELFYKHSQMGDGHLNKCIECTKSDVRKHRSENESVQAYDRARYYTDPKRRARLARNAEVWCKKYPERYRAHYTVHNAIRDGKLTKGVCEVCGSEKVHAHHHDYSKPLDVIWLCPKHHQKLHVKERENVNHVHCRYT